MGTQAKRQQDWEKTRKRKSTTSGFNRYNPTQPPQFTKTISSEQYKVLCQDKNEKR